MIRVAIILAVFFCAWVPLDATAKPARCFNSDDGTYPCDFQAFGGNGSFTVRAPGKPSYTLSIQSRGVADGYANYGSGNIFIPGPFYRSNRDRACWVSNATGFQICAY